MQENPEWERKNKLSCTSSTDPQGVFPKYKQRVTSPNELFRIWNEKPESWVPHEFDEISYEMVQFLFRRVLCITDSSPGLLSHPKCLVGQLSIFCLSENFQVESFLIVIQLINPLSNSLSRTVYLITKPDPAWLPRKSPVEYFISVMNRNYFFLFGEGLILLLILVSLGFPIVCFVSVSHNSTSHSIKLIGFFIGLCACVRAWMYVCCLSETDSTSCSSKAAELCQLHWINCNPDVRANYWAKWMQNCAISWKCSWCDNVTITKCGQ